MKRSLLLFLACLVTSSVLLPGPAGAEPLHQVEAAPPVLCLPGVYPTPPAECLPLGPSQYLTRLAALGVSFPLHPLPASAADPSLAVVPFSYARLKEETTPVYATLEDAQAGVRPVGAIDAGGLKFISYVEAVDTGGSPKPDYFKLKSGGWVSGVAGRLSSVPLFQGLVFYRTPDHPFGWVTPLNDFVETKRTPGYALQDYTGHKLYKYEVVSIYTSQRVGNADWYMVAPDEWVEQTSLGIVFPDTTPPQGVVGDRWIAVNLYEQTLAVYQDRQLVFATLVATGLDPFFTRPGVFQIYKRLESGVMSGAFETDRSDFYYLEDVPWTLYYDQARALHGAYWRTAFGFPQSHGCINLSPGDAHWLFDWAQVGDWVYIWDPSGNTPTDPAYYNEGGA